MARRPRQTGIGMPKKRNKMKEYYDMRLTRSQREQAKVLPTPSIVLQNSSLDTSARFIAHLRLTNLNRAEDALPGSVLHPFGPDVAESTGRGNMSDGNFGTTQDVSYAMPANKRNSR